MFVSYFMLVPRRMFVANIRRRLHLTCLKTIHVKLKFTEKEFATCEVVDQTDTDTETDQASLDRQVPRFVTNPNSEFRFQSSFESSFVSVHLPQVLY
jgi:hypothetical protein